VILVNIPMQCLVIMPFRAEFDAVFTCVREAAEKASTDPAVDCYWLKDFHGAGRITDDIMVGLGKAAFCVADLTGNNPNVMWETGYAMALGRPVILIGQSIGSIPFDLNNHRLLEYDAGRLDVLRDRLTRAIEQTVIRICSTRLSTLPAQLYWLGHDLARAIRFGMHEDADRIELQKCLLFAIHHLDRVELAAPDSRQLLLAALRRSRNNAPFSVEEKNEFVGRIAQAKNDLGDAFALLQPGFVPYPSPQDRARIIAEAENLKGDA
jgi:hypothetical protein